MARRRIVIVPGGPLSAERRRDQRERQHGGRRARQDPDGEGDAGDDLRPGVDRHEALGRQAGQPR